VIEIKYFYECVDVYDDWLVSVNNFQMPSVFSLLETKAKVFSTKIHKEFGWENPPFVNSRVIVGPDDITVKYKYKNHETNGKLLKLRDAIRVYKEIEKGISDDETRHLAFGSFKSRIRRYAENLQPNQKKSHRLGRFSIKRLISKGRDFAEYWGCDEPPCNVDVYLKEYPFDQFGKNEDIQEYLKKITYGMQILRGLRHQYISCVIGHFQTGCSLVQINDWFDGKSLNDNWREISELGLEEKINLMIKICQGIGFCHEKGVFHRNISADNVLINNDLDDIRITGFDYAKDIDYSHSITSTLMKERNTQLIPPEELVGGGIKVNNLRLYDIYQTGLLFFRICENGSWPFDDPLEYCTGDGRLPRQPLDECSSAGARELSSLIGNMLSVVPDNRPNLMKRVEDDLERILALSFR